MKSFRSFHRSGLKFKAVQLCRPSTFSCFERPVWTTLTVSMTHYWLASTLIDFRPLWPQKTKINQWVINLHVIFSCLWPWTYAQGNRWNIWQAWNGSSRCQGEKYFDQKQRWMLYWWSWFGHSGRLFQITQLWTWAKPKSTSWDEKIYGTWNLEQYHRPGKNVL